VEQPDHGAEPQGERGKRPADARRVEGGQQEVEDERAGQVAQGQPLQRAVTVAQEKPGGRAAGGDQPGGRRDRGQQVERSRAEEAQGRTR
jgi:hypothetical protein